MHRADFVVIGGGIIGLTIARELRHRFSDASILLLEKEHQLGAHASGRNSGVLHAGFYYVADSLKAKFTRDGNAAWQQYCAERGLPLNCCGKLVVAKNVEEIDGLRELQRRGQQNGIELEWIDAKQAQAIEPRIKTYEHALWSPTTASVDPVRIVESVAREITGKRLQILYDAEVLGVRGSRLRTRQGPVEGGYIINAAGLYADRVATWFGFSRHFRILPFKGLYLYSNEPAGNLRTNIYPVPDLRNPFLGVHFTITVDGHIKIGPTAIPVLWRENYEGLANFRLRELFDVCRREIALFFASDFDFKRLALAELRKYSRRRMVHLASELASGVRYDDYRHWGKPGIRAQLLDTRTNRLVMDFVIEGDDRSLHVLNAVSPALTCAIPFARYVTDEIAGKLNKERHRDAGTKKNSPARRL